MNYKIVADSSADIISFDAIPFSSASLKITTAEREFTDNRELDVHEMLLYLKSYKGRSHSSCPNTEEFLEAFGDAENIFCITITSNLSGSYNAASKAASDYISAHPERKVHVIDSLSVGPESALIAEKLRELILSGLSFEEIKEKITKYNVRTRLIFALESMHNLANNGRVNSLIAKMAGILGVRAIGRASDVGTLDMVCKSRGLQKTVSDVIKTMITDGYCGGKVRIHHAENETGATLLRETIMKSYPKASVEIYQARGLCCFYAEHGGLLVGFET